MLLLLTGGYSEADLSWEDFEIYGRFFDQSVYKALAATRDPNYKQEIAKQALEKFVTLAAERGIQTKNITQAMFAGKLNPHMDDLRLVYEGLGHPQGVDPYGLYSRGDVAFHRNREWRQRFGGLTEEQLFRLGQRLHKFPRTEYGSDGRTIVKGPNDFSYNDVKNDPIAQMKMDDLRNNNNSALAYFRLHDSRTPALDLGGEYDRYRAKYITIIKAEEQSKILAEVKAAQDRAAGIEKPDELVRKAPKKKVKPELPLLVEETLQDYESPAASEHIEKRKAINPPHSEEEITHEEVTSNPIEAFVYFFMNSGAFLEFGDEIFCTVKSWAGDSNENIFSSSIIKSCRDGASQKVAHIENNYSWIALIGAILGYILLAPTAMIHKLIYGVPKNQSAPEKFKSALKFETAEGAICVFGQVLTDGNLALASLSLGMGVMSGFIRGGGLYFMHRWKKESLFRMSVVFWCVIAVFGFIYFSGFSSPAHAGGFGGAFAKAVKGIDDIRTPPAPKLEYNPPGMGGSSSTPPTSYGTPYNPTWHMPGVTKEPKAGMTEGIHKKNFNNYSKGYK